MSFSRSPSVELPVVCCLDDVLLSGTTGRRAGIGGGEFSCVGGSCNSCLAWVSLMAGPGMVIRRCDHRRSSRLFAALRRQRGVGENMFGDARVRAILTLHGIAGAGVFGDLFPFVDLEEKCAAQRAAGGVCDRGHPWDGAAAQWIFSSGGARWKTGLEDLHPANWQYRVLRSCDTVSGVPESSKNESCREVAIPAKESVESLFGRSLDRLREFEF